MSADPKKAATKDKSPAPATAVPGTAPSTAVARRDDVADLLNGAKTPQERARLFEFATQVEQAKAIRRASNLLATTEWGAKLTDSGRAAFGRYCLELGGDPLRHVDILGGNPFINGEYYRDVIAANPDFHHSDDPRWIHDDPRLQLCVACGEKFGDKPDHGHNLEVVTATNSDRMMERIERAKLRLQVDTPDTDVATCIVTLHYGNNRGPFVGIGRARGGTVTRNKRDGGTYTVSADPIGQESPRETAETRAWREAGEKAEPVWFRNHPRLKEAEAKLIELHTSGQLIEPPVDAEPPAAIGVETSEASAPAPAEQVAEAAAEPLPIENHNPTKVCDISGPHPREMCGYHKSKQ